MTDRWGQPLDWRNIDTGSCVRHAVHHAFGIPLQRIPPRPTHPSDKWADEFVAGLRRAGLHLALIPSRDLELTKGERWVALIIDHAVAMVGMRVLHDSAGRWARGERLDAPIIAGLVRRRARVDRWGKVAA